MSAPAIALIVLLALAIIVAVVMAIRLNVRARNGEPVAASGGTATVAGGPQWFQVAGALIVLAALVILAIALVTAQWPGGDAEVTAGGWREQTGSTVFTVLMLIAGAVGLLAYVVYLVTRVGRPLTAAPIAPSVAEETAPTPTAVRLLGLLLLVVLVLLGAWAYSTPAEQYQLMLNVLYPAAFAVALVLLFDKASRTWQQKTAAESVREWLLCDAIAFLLVIGFLNLLRHPAPDQYGALFWDVVHVAAFFFIFWLLDRKRTRLRFLATYAYLIVLPMLLLLWRAAYDTPEAEETVEATVAWWSTVWPFFWLAVVFFVLEIISLTAARASERHGLGAIKEALFVLLAAITLFNAIPAAA